MVIIGGLLIILLAFSQISTLLAFTNGVNQTYMYRSSAYRAATSHVADCIVLPGVATPLIEEIGYFHYNCDGVNNRFSYDIDNDINEPDANPVGEPIDGRQWYQVIINGIVITIIILVAVGLLILGGGTGSPGGCTINIVGGMTKLAPC